MLNAIRRSLVNGRFLGAVLTLAVSLWGAALLIAPASVAHVRRAVKHGPVRDTGLSQSSCHLGGPYKHVVYIQFDNQHLMRDNPNVPSDLEQVPALKNFLAGNGTLSNNQHTPLISHTAGDIVTSLTGLYPNRNGLGVANSYLQYQAGTGQIQKTPSGGFFGPTAFTYWTDPVSSSSIPSPTDPLPNLITDGQNNTPAPWVAYTRAGCDVGAFSIADMELENTGPDISSAFGNPSNQYTYTSTSSSASNPPSSALKAADFEGIAIHCSQADSNSGPGHQGLCSSNNGGVTDKLPAQPDGPYSGFNALFGAIYANQVTSKPGAYTPSTQSPAGAAHGGINDLAAPVNDVYGYNSPGCHFCANGTNQGYNGQPITTSEITDSGKATGNSGFPSGFDPTPAQTLGYTAAMQESGVPVTFSYIEDAHNAWTSPYSALGPGQQTYEDQLKQENQAFSAFFERLAADGINKSNTLFVITADEGDHFAGGPPTNAGCDGVTTPCTYTGTTGPNSVGEEDAYIDNALSREFADNNPFDIHFDDAANFYVHGAPGSTAPPGPYDASVRQLEQDLGKLTLVDQRTGQSVPVTQHLADAEDQSILHMTTTDPLRTPTFTDFGNPTFYYETGGTCASGSSPGCPFVAASNAWNHGGDQPEVTRTWLGVVGPTVRNLGETNRVWSDHTDIRPTMLSLLGLRSSYVNDGSALTQFMRPDALPRGVHKDRWSYQNLAAVYRQLNAAVGQFGHDSEIVSTTGSESSSDAVAQGFDQQLAACQSQRDALAGRIKNLLSSAVFGHESISPRTASWLSQRGLQLIWQMDELSRYSTPPTFTACSSSSAGHWGPAHDLR